MEGSFSYYLVVLYLYKYTGTAEGQVLSTKAEHKYNREQILQANRGKIVDRNGEVISAGYT